MMRCVLIVTLAALNSQRGVNGGHLFPSHGRIIQDTVSGLEYDQASGFLEPPRHVISSQFTGVEYSMRFQPRMSERWC